MPCGIAAAPRAVPEPMAFDRTRLPFSRRDAMAVLLAILFAIVYLHVSEIGGRLSYDMTYDDVSYANEAAGHLRHLVAEGFPGLLRSLREVPPHSPWATGLAMLAFLVGGIDDFALYASNTVLLVIAAVFVARRGESSAAGAFAL